jgi:RNA polymerase sigma factor (sigma-70 family)
MIALAAPVLRRIRTRLQQLLRRRGRTREDAEDLIQEAFLRLQAYYQRGVDVREPEALLARIALRLSMNARRDERRHPHADDVIESLPLLDLEAIPEDVLEAEQFLQRMNQTLESLSPLTRDFFYLNRVDGLSYAQIAKLHGVTTKAVERRLARAMLALSDEENPS